jgi:RecA/RadA recombinase
MSKKELSLKEKLLEKKKKKTSVVEPEAPAKKKKKDLPEPASAAQSKKEIRQLRKANKLVKEKIAEAEASTSKKAKSKKESTLKETPNETKKGKKGKKEIVEEAKASMRAVVSYDDMMDGIEKKYDTNSSQLAMDPRAKLSTGLLVQDLVLSGGLLGGGWYTFFGQEQSAKSTLAMQSIIACLHTDVPLIQYWDYEGSSSPDYIENMMKSMRVPGDITHVFGLRDAGGTWVVKPRVRYYQPETAETFFDSLAKLLRTLPSIKMVGDKQYYIWPDEKVFRAQLKSGWDEKLLKKTGMLHVETETYIKHQALIVVDSYPAMLPEKQDEDDPGSAMAVQARMFSEQIKRVKSKMKPKKVTIIGINQLRLRPMVAYGNPEYEPCGEALKLFSDARIRCASRSIPHGKGSLEEEPSVTGTGIDTYRYVNWRAQKNKLGAPNLEGWGRIWVSDNEGKGRGFCPVYDVYEYLKMTGQISGSRNKLAITLPQFKNVKLKISWMMLKTLVSGTKEQQVKTQKKLGIEKYFNLRKVCFAQFDGGKAMELFFAKKAGAAEAPEEDED